MTAGVTEARTMTRRRWLTIERCLLVGIIALQTAMLVVLWRRSATPPSPEFPDGEASWNLPRALDESATDPLQQARDVMADMDALFERTVTEFERMGAFFDLDDGWNAVMTSPAMDMRAQQNHYVVVFSLPTPRPSDLRVLLDGRVLTILTVFDQPALVRRYGEPLQFEKRVRLPGPVGDAELAAAQLTNGLLRVSVPRGSGYGVDPGFRRLM